MWSFLRSAIVGAAACLAVVTNAAAQDASAGEPLMGSESSPGELPVAAASPQSGENMPNDFAGTDGVYRILVIGDDLAGGFGAGLSRMAEGDERFDVVNRFNEASGLARPERYDWSQAAPKILTTKTFDALLVHVGVNDRQPIRSAAGQLQFRSADWEAAYRKQVDALLDVAKQAGIKTYWIALPPMADPAFDADMRYLNGIYKASVDAKGGLFVDLRGVLTAPDGSYLDRGPDETGEERKLRTRDGVAFLKQGNNRMGQLILAVIKSDVSGVAASKASPVVAGKPSVADTQASIPGTGVTIAKPETQQTIAVGAGVPQFGHVGLEGEVVVFTPSVDDQKPEAGAVAPAVQTAQASSAAAAAARESMAPVGSSAYVLFSEGLSPEPVTGRFDDFGIVAAP